MSFDRFARRIWLEIDNTVDDSLKSCIEMKQLSRAACSAVVAEETSISGAVPDLVGMKKNGNDKSESTITGLAAFEALDRKSPTKREKDITMVPGVVVISPPDHLPYPLEKVLTLESAFEEMENSSFNGSQQVTEDSDYPFDEQTGEMHCRHWRPAVDKKTGKRYYNRLTRQSTWTKPAGFEEVRNVVRFTESDFVNGVKKSVTETRQDQVPTDGSVDCSLCDVPVAELSKSDSRGYWKRACDPKTGKFYYYNSLSRQTTWSMPDDFETNTKETQATPVKPSVVQEASADKTRNSELGERHRETLPTSILRKPSNAIKDENASGNERQLLNGNSEGLVAQSQSGAKATTATSFAEGLIAPFPLSDNFLHMIESERFQNEAFCSEAQRGIHGISDDMVHLAASSAMEAMACCVSASGETEKAEIEKNVGFDLTESPVQLDQQGILQGKRVESEKKAYDFDKIEEYDSIEVDLKVPEQKTRRNFFSRFTSTKKSKNQGFCDSAVVEKSATMIPVTSKGAEGDGILVPLAETTCDKNESFVAPLRQESSSSETVEGEKPKSLYTFASRMPSKENLFRDAPREEMKNDDGMLESKECVLEGETGDRTAEMPRKTYQKERFLQYFRKSCRTEVRDYSADFLSDSQPTSSTEDENLRSERPTQSNFQTTPPDNEIQNNEFVNDASEIRGEPANPETEKASFMFLGGSTAESLPFVGGVGLGKTKQTERSVDVEMQNNKSASSTGFKENGLGHQDSQTELVSYGIVAENVKGQRTSKGPPNQVTEKSSFVFHGGSALEPWSCVGCDGLGQTKQTNDSIDVELQKTTRSPSSDFTEANCGHEDSPREPISHSTVAANEDEKETAKDKGFPRQPGDENHVVGEAMSMNNDGLEISPRDWTETKESVCNGPMNNDGIEVLLNEGTATKESVSKDPILADWAPNAEVPTFFAPEHSGTCQQLKTQEDKQQHFQKDSEEQQPPEDLACEMPLDEFEVAYDECPTDRSLPDLPVTNENRKKNIRSLFKSFHTLPKAVHEHNQKGQDRASSHVGQKNVNEAMPSSLSNTGTAAKSKQSKQAILRKDRGSRTPLALSFAKRKRICPLESPERFEFQPGFHIEIDSACIDEEKTDDPFIQKASDINSEFQPGFHIEIDSENIDERKTDEPFIQNPSDTNSDDKKCKRRSSYTSNTISPTVSIFKDDEISESATNEVTVRNYKSESIRERRGDACLVPENSLNKRTKLNSIFQSLLRSKESEENDHDKTYSSPSTLQISAKEKSPTSEEIDESQEKIKKNIREFEGPVELMKTGDDSRQNNGILQVADQGQYSDLKASKKSEIEFKQRYTDGIVMETISVPTADLLLCCSIDSSDRQDELLELIDTAKGSDECEGQEVPISDVTSNSIDSDTVQAPKIAEFHTDQRPDEVDSKKKRHLLPLFKAFSKSSKHKEKQKTRKPHQNSSPRTQDSPSESNTEYLQDCTSPSRKNISSKEPRVQDRVIEEHVNETHSRLSENNKQMNHTNVENKTDVQVPTSTQGCHQPTSSVEASEEESVEKNSAFHQDTLGGQNVLPNAKGKTKNKRHQSKNNFGNQSIGLLKNAILFGSRKKTNALDFPHPLPKDIPDVQQCESQNEIEQENATTGLQKRTSSAMNEGNTQHIPPQDTDQTNSISMKQTPLENGTGELIKEVHLQNESTSIGGESIPHSLGKLSAAHSTEDICSSTGSRTNEDMYSFMGQYTNDEIYSSAGEVTLTSAASDDSRFLSADEFSIYDAEENYMQPSCTIFEALDSLSVQADTRYLEKSGTALTQTRSDTSSLEDHSETGQVLSSQELPFRETSILKTLFAADPMQQKSTSLPTRRQKTIDLKSSSSLPIHRRSSNALKLVSPKEPQKPSSTKTNTHGQPIEDTLNASSVVSSKTEEGQGTGISSDEQLGSEHSFQSMISELIHELEFDIEERKELLPHKNSNSVDDGTACTSLTTSGLDDKVAVGREVNNKSLSIPEIEKLCLRSVWKLCDRVDTFTGHDQHQPLRREE